MFLTERAPDAGSGTWVAIASTGWIAYSPAFPLTLANHRVPGASAADLPRHSPTKEQAGCRPLPPVLR